MPDRTIHHYRMEPVVCVPPARAFLMWVGAEYTMSGFRDEGWRMGVSKRIPRLPADFQIGDWVFLAKQHVCPTDSQGWMPGLAVEKRGLGPGVFLAFKPNRVELVVDQSDYDRMVGLDGEIVPGEVVGRYVTRELIEKGVTLVPVPDADPDHHDRKAVRAGV